jgi:two-component system cell cycle response regulator
MKTRAVNVLVVEDDLVDFKAVERALSRYSEPMFLLQRADSMEKGKRMLEDHDYDAVILDLGLPDVSGIDSVVHFQANAPETPIVVLTGQGDNHLAKGAVGLGAEDFLLKSELGPERLEEKLRLAMERHRTKLNVLQSVDALERTVSHLSEKAHRDALTGLANRLGLEEHLSLLRSQGARLIPVAMVDLDDFKAINDIHGHAAGDRVLSELGRRIQVAAGPDAFVARVGGDEFVAIFAALKRPQAEAQAHALCSAVAAKPFSVGATAEPLTLTATIVLSEMPAVDLALEPILTITHERLKHGKVHGKDQVLCTWEMGEAAESSPANGARVAVDGVETLGAPTVLLGCMEVIAYRLRFVARPEGGFIEDRQVDLARLNHKLDDLTLACVRQALAWGDGPPYPSIHMDLEIDVLNQGFAEKLLRAIPGDRDRERLCFFLPAQFTEEQGERASKVVRTLRQSGFNFGLRDAGGGGTMVENLMLLQPSWIRLSHLLCNGVSQVKAKRERLQHWIGLLSTLKAPLLADQASDKDLETLEELGLLGAVLAKLSRELRY